MRGYSPPLQGPPALPVRGHSADVQRLVSSPQEPAGLPASEPTAKRSTTAGHTTPATTSAAPVRAHQQRHHAYAPEGEEEECRAALPLPLAAISRSAPVPHDAHFHEAQGTAHAVMDDDFLSYGRRSPARDATLGRRDQAVHRYGELLHLLHALRYLADGSAEPLVDHLIAQFSDLTRRDW